MYLIIFVYWTICLLEQKLYFKIMCMPPPALTYLGGVQKNCVVWRVYVGGCLSGG